MHGNLILCHPSSHLSSNSSFYHAFRENNGAAPRLIKSTEAVPSRGLRHGGRGGGRHADGEGGAGPRGLPGGTEEGQDVLQPVFLVFTGSGTVWSAQCAEYCYDISAVSISEYCYDTSVVCISEYCYDIQ